MSASPRSLFRPWLIVPLLAAGFLIWCTLGPARKAGHLIALDPVPPAADAKSPTGYANGQRRLIVPDYNKESYQWIMQTQQMAATGEWRVRRVDYDNAPLGRPVQSPSPYRWWLASVGWLMHLVHGVPIGATIELAAIPADPILHLLLLAGLAVFVARRFGAWQSALVSVSAVTLYPLAGAFLPGVPSDLGLSLLLVTGSVLPLIATQLPATTSAPSSRLGLTIAGVAGGIGLWVNPGIQFPILIASCLGLAAALWFNRANASALAAPWRTWAVSGAVTATIGFLLENAPDRLDFSALDLSENHPLYALGWLGAGQLLHALGAGRNRPGGKLRIPLLGLAIAAVLSVPTMIFFKGQRGFLIPDTYATTLTSLGTWTEADSLAAWWRRDGLTLALFATLTPCLFIAIALWQCVSQPAKRPALLAALLPLLTALGFACTQLSWWNVTGTLLLGLLAVLTTPIPGSKPTAENRILWIGAFALLLGPGIAALWPAAASESEPNALTKTERNSLAERDLARWLARRSGPDGAIVLAPPSLTVSCLYHGGLRGLGTPYRENEEGFRASVRIAGATSADEAYALVKQRKATHVIIPSWDDFLDTYALLGSNQPENTLIGQLRLFRPPRWLKPVAYPLAAQPGGDDQYVFIFDVTDLQDGVTGLSRAAEYFVEMSQLQLAGEACKTLVESFAGDPNALAARAHYELARKNRPAFLSLLREIETSVAQGADEALPWDRRLSLALVLMAGQRTELARTQATRCVEEMGEYDLRGLSTERLAEFSTLIRTLGLKNESPELDKLIAELLTARPAARP